MRPTEGLSTSEHTLLVDAGGAEREVDYSEIDEDVIEQARCNFKSFRKIMKLKRINDNDRMLNGRRLAPEQYEQFETAALYAVEDIIDSGFLPKDRATEIFFEAADLETEKIRSERRVRPSEKDSFTDEELIAHHRNVMRFRDIRLLRETRPGQDDYLPKEARAIQSGAAMISERFLPAETVIALLEEAMRLRKGLE